ncbi:hypothetical protein LV84_04158 [Algoriphagus ratkowskyi]|uniref:Uncharacterized protein n=1 Tax=Algoriphagus ratkowskyi TaxID=57028 RepID=A0A2W7QNA1_9BACT|nr:hypothetical protein [Algoriphagus ratkowskyi]PZX49968.1 hypothetical protein LV84_04158 [Algoriphagus ratkowskyi]TXD75537.1 hypothetical protein ESW18_20205 [Algoriphagus ratkowskyi]
MAKQAGVITLNGKVGTLSFYKTKDGYLAREKGGVSKSRIMNDPRFARTRENLKEFADNATSAKLFRDALRPVIAKIGDTRLSQRITRVMMKVLQSDLVNNRGERMVRAGDWNLLGDLELNAACSLGSTLFLEIAYIDSPTSWNVNIPAFVPQDFVAVPKGATHLRITATGVGLDFSTGARTVQTSISSLLSVIDSAVAISLSIDKALLPGTHRAFVLSVEFVQMVNGGEYSINNGAHNAAKITGVEQI